MATAAPAGRNRRGWFVAAVVLVVALVAAFLWWRAAGDRAGEEEMLVTAYFSYEPAEGRSGEPLRAVHRVRPRSPAVLQAALEVLLAGPTAAEREADLGSWFSSRTATMLRSVTLRDGHAVVDLDDLRPIIPNASTSAGSRRLLAELDATVFQFPTVESVEYRLEGDCEAFNEWLQRGGCDARTRPTR